MRGEMGSTCVESSTGSGEIPAEHTHTQSGLQCGDNCILNGGEERREERRREEERREEEERR